MKYILIVLFGACVVLASADYSEEENILRRCKYINCKDVNDLNKESRIRRCIKVNCNSRDLKKAGVADYCKRICVEEGGNFLDNEIIKGVTEGPPTILDYSWLE